MKTAENIAQAVGITGNTPFNLGMTKCLPKIQSWLGRAKWDIEQDLLRLNYSTTRFAHWVYVQELGVLLSFEHQICVASMAINANRF